MARRAAVARAGQHAYDEDSEAETTQRAVALGTAAAIAAIRASQHDSDPPAAKRAKRWEAYAKGLAALIAAVGAVYAALRALFVSR